MAAKTKYLDELFHESLKDIYFAEKKLLTALPKMAKAARSAQTWWRIRRSRRSDSPARARAAWP